MTTDQARRRSRRKRRRPADAEPWRRYLWKGRSDPEAVAHAKESYAGEQIVARMRRRFANDLGHPKICRRKGCRRTGVCTVGECLVDLPPVEETPETQAALKAFREAIRARVAELKAAED